MQNDLISRSELLKWIPFWGGDIESMIEFIANMPTAYDVEKVTKELSDFVLNTEQYCVEHIANGICEDCESCNECVLRKAIEIVRNGGKE